MGSVIASFTYYHIPITPSLHDSIVPAIKIGKCFLYNAKSHQIIFSNLIWHAAPAFRPYFRRYSIYPFPGGGDRLEGFYAHKSGALYR